MMSHDQAIKEMSKFFESDRPQLGIFWFNPVQFSLFGVGKMDAEECLAQNHLTYPKLHKTFWQKQHHRARSKDDKTSMYYDEHNYTLIPRGRIFYDEGKFVVKVGDWHKEIDQERFSELIQDEFNIPESLLVVEYDTQGIENRESASNACRVVGA